MEWLERIRQLVPYQRTTPTDDMLDVGAITATQFQEIPALRALRFFADELYKLRGWWFLLLPVLGWQGYRAYQHESRRQRDQAAINAALTAEAAEREQEAARQAQQAEARRERGLQATIAAAVARQQTEDAQAAFVSGTGAPTGGDTPTTS